MSKARRIKDILDDYGHAEAIIYCRVSSDRQVSEGHGLDSQESRCIKRALEQGLKVVQIFREEGVSGKLFDRPEMTKLISYLDAHPRKKYVIIFDDLKRFARDMEVHLKLKTELVTKRGAKLECLNFSFENSPIGRAIENIMATTAQLEREQNTEQVVNKMKARLENGYWSFGRRKGYDMVQKPEHGKISVANLEGLEMLAPALEGFANGTFVRKIDVVRFLMSKGFWKTQKPEKYIDKITAIMRDPFYAGYIEYPMWEVSRRPGHHQGVISLETFELIQKRLRKNDLNQRVRIDTSPDFPHRGLIICADCKMHLTGCWFPGRKNKYRRYICHKASCPSYNKIIRAENVESEFQVLLKKGRLKKNVDVLSKEVFDRTWDDEIAKIRQEDAILGQKKRAMEDKLTELTNMVVSAKSVTLKDVYEKQMEDTAKQIEVMEEKSIIGLDMSIPYQTAFYKAALLLKKPDIAWVKFNVHDQHNLFFFLFMQKLPYSRKEGYQTAEIPTAAMLFEDFAVETTHLVEMPGVKPGSKTSRPFHCSQD